MPDLQASGALVRDVVRETSAAADVMEVTDIGEIMAYGVMHTPGLVIEGELKSVGRVPSKQEIAAWLADAVRA